MSQDKVEMNVDIVMCIDATGSMGGVIEMVKENAMSFHEKLIEKLNEIGRDVVGMRVKVIPFRDLTCNEDMAVSEWFELPSEAADFKKFVSDIKATGGGDEPETAIDAISLAMKQDWVQIGVKKRHIILLWTDASTKMPGIQKLRPDLPQSMAEVFKMWGDPQDAVMDPSCKRMILFVPEHESWNFAEDMDLVSPQYYDLGSGLDGLTMDVVLDVLAKSV